MNTREQFLLGIRFVLIVALGAVIGLMLGRTWVPGTIAHDAVYGTAVLFDVGYGTPEEILPSFVLGSYLGLLALFTADWRKRVQGVLLIIGTAVGLYALWTRGVLLANIDLYHWTNVAALLGGLGTAALLEFGAIKRQAFSTSIDHIEFDIAVVSVFVSFSTLAVLGLLQAVSVGAAVPIVDVPATIAFVYVLFGFIAYDATTKTAIIGPRESGKTTSIVGLYQRFSDRDKIPAETSPALDEHIEEVDTMAEDEDFKIRGTQETHDIGFYFQVGDIFPMRARFTTFDHPGEKIDDIARELRDPPGVKRRLQHIGIWFSEMLPGMALSDHQREIQFYNHVRTADILMLLIDMERIVENRPAYLSDLKTIANGTKDTCRIFVVATKSDLALKDYAGLQQQLKPGIGDELLHDDDGMEKSPADEFTDNLTADRIQINELMKTVSTDVIYPVYFMTKQSEDGQSLVPDLDENGRLQPVGYEELIERIENEAMKNVRV
ncbi:hypothetical protein [Halorubrum vacuolatum]|uniref:Uncharacterized protein n=1 Tax=Halorubrum vacuolatum TaxID=63740 RepID=A0A238YA32_HALVU|nr:hypothetical protein [Halorubrum vacuolatum]SNR67678.1 hypothetical protein SAMN06264855_13411 [Halorubrum vacuolatum]